MGTWKDLKKELMEAPPKEMTIREFAPVYLEEHCKIRNTRPDFKEETLRVINQIVGDVNLKAFRRSDAAYFEKERAKSMSGATVNRGLAVLSNMLTFALKKGLIEIHPMARYGRIPEDEKALRVMELKEERRLVSAVHDENHVVGCYVGVLGETALRMTEGLLLKWDFVNLEQGILTVEASKNYRARHIPLSDYAIELLRSLPRVVGCPFVFVRLESMDRWRDPRGPFHAGKEATGIDWVGFHDFRHFRATQWVKRGIDLRTVQELLGHRDITTTMRYAHFAPGHASRSILEAQRLEAAEFVAGEKQETEKRVDSGSNRKKRVSRVK
jgi:integrase